MPMEAAEAVKHAIEMLRLQFGLSQAAAAAAVGISEATWNNVENGRETSPSRRTIVAMARSLQWDIDWWDRINRGGQSHRRRYRARCRACLPAHAQQVRSAICSTVT